MKNKHSPTPQVYTVKKTKDTKGHDAILKEFFLKDRIKSYNSTLENKPNNCLPPKNIKLTETFFYHIQVNYTPYRLLKDTNLINCPTPSVFVLSGHILPNLIF